MVQEVTTMTTEPPRYTLGTMSDAGLLREYLVHTYAGSFFIGQGLGYEAYATFLRLSRRLARLASKSLEEVWSDLRADAEAIG
jgi:hypothetical protein